MRAKRGEIYWCIHSAFCSSQGKQNAGRLSFHCYWRDEVPTMKNTPYRKSNVSSMRKPLISEERVKSNPQSIFRKASSNPQESWEVLPSLNARIKPPVPWYQPHNEPMEELETKLKVATLNRVPLHVAPSFALGSGQSYGACFILQYRKNTVCEIWCQN